MDSRGRTPVKMREPDPSTRMLRSGFGSQVRSSSPSEPAFGFGTGVRDASLRQYLSPEHARAMHGNNSQGPVYKVYSSLGQQPDSTVPNPGSMTFGTSARLIKYGTSGVPGPGHYRVPPALGEQKESRRSTCARAVFGTAPRDSTSVRSQSAPPGAYNVPGALGRQVASTKESAPGIKIGSSLRALDYEVMRAKNLPGAGSYESYNALGAQPLSNKKSLPAHSFGRSSRDASKKTFISKEHEKQAFGMSSPGPGTAKPYTSSGPQKLSTRSTNPTWGFGTSQRLPSYEKDTTPGPGTYYA